MLDTIKIGVTYEMSPQELKGWRDAHGEQKNGYVTHKKTYAVTAPNNCTVTCSYISTSFIGRPLLTLGFSLPKLLYGNNIQAVTDLGAAIAEANEMLASLPEIPVVDIGKGEILRLDIAFNHKVGDLVKEYIDYLSRQGYSRRKTHTYLHETVYFSNKSVSSMFYDKFNESKMVEASGIFRQEISFTNKRRIYEIFGIKHLEDLGFPIIKEELEKDLVALGLDKPIANDGRCSWVTLVKKHGYYAATFLYGLNMVKGIFPIAEIAQHGGKHHRTINRQVLKGLQNSYIAGFSPSKEDLPALSIDYDIISDKRIVAKNIANE